MESPLRMDETIARATNGLNKLREIVESLSKQTHSQFRKAKQKSHHHDFWF
jgi:hypothetical protein